MLWQYNRMFGSNPPLLVVLLYSMKNVVLQPLAQASSTLFKYPAGVFFIFPSFPIFDAIPRAHCGTRNPTTKSNPADLCFIFVSCSNSRGGFLTELLGCKNKSSRTVQTFDDDIFRKINK